MRTQEENKKERKELKEWESPQLKILSKSNTSSGESPAFSEAMEYDNGPADGVS